ncbi:MAG: esterase, partial [Verrucomicrobia bacterium]|nr:esterase [Verrucomicrobiota bacterium]
MKKSILISAVLAMIGTPVFAQQSFDFSRRNIISPEISSSNTVTFKLLAPNAKEVKVSGDWIPSEGWIPGSKSLTKDENGIWSYTTEPLASELYSYSFNVDGLKVLDPNNVYANRDIANIMNIFIIGGGQADLYKVSNVPHGSVTRAWYNSETLGVSRRLTIYTPPGYESSTEKYPVFYLLHGAGGDEEAWMALGRASQILDNLIAQGKAKPMIVVMPNGHTANASAPGESDKGLYKPDMSTMMRSGFAGEME